MGQRPRSTRSWGHGRAATARPELAALGRWIEETPAGRAAPPAARPPRRPSASSASPSRSTARPMRRERIIPFDIVPRVFLADEWARLSEGLVQRVEAINAFLDDIYGERADPEGGRAARPSWCSATRSSAPRSPACARRTASGRISAASIWSAPAPTNSSCWRTMRARRRACQLHAREPRGDDPAVPRAVPRFPRRARSTAIPTCCSRRCGRSRRTARVAARSASC